MPDRDPEDLHVPLGPGDPAGEVAAACLEAGLLVGTAGETVLRLTPPLTITGDELDAGLSLFEEVLT